MRKKKEEIPEGQISLDVFLEKSKADEKPPIWEKPEAYINPPEKPVTEKAEVPAKRKVSKRKTASTSKQEKVAKVETSDDIKAAEVKASVSEVVNKPVAKKRRSLKKKELKECAEKVMAEYDYVRIGGIMRVCHVSAMAAEQVLTYMEEQEYTRNHKVLKKRVVEEIP